MKMRAFLLIIILVGGTYAMIQSYTEYNEKNFRDFVGSLDTEFTSLVFNQPSTTGATPNTWMVEDEGKIDDLISFLDNYQIRKLKQEEVIFDVVEPRYSISLKDNNHNVLTIFLDENIIIQSDSNYYEIVGGPIDVAWLQHFFINSQK
ncbi:hypothetical protein [Sporosarcina sp. HYO08]|uniref:hypothetical protein n=1 Tax=Sporosarcina sp. HYO08 TaxID=1759557 RepID=UPI000793026E|nr:hypothetical protein [Sporosarcina sp. HYO08]KXH87113.1 hypothetical protein AU377_00615 [Sporosarcina sp. HYO08]